MLPRWYRAGNEACRARWLVLITVGFLALAPVGWATSLGPEDGSHTGSEGGEPTPYGTRSQTMHYTVGTIGGTGVGVCNVQVSEVPQNAGAVCAELLGNEAQLDVEVHDATGFAVPAAITFFDDGFAGRVYFCGSASSVPIPEGAQSVVIYLSMQDPLAAADWPDCLPHAMATMGEVHLLWHLDGPDPEPVMPSHYRLARNFQWDQPVLNVLVVPPAHGPINSPDGALLPDGVEGATPWGTYFQATMDVIGDWLYARDRYVEDYPEHAWLAGMGLDVRVAGQDDVVSFSPDVVVAFTESMATVMGLAVWNGVRCVAVNSMIHPIQAYTLTYADMYSLAGHEFGHCLGMDHPQDHQPLHDIMSYEPWPYPAPRCPSNLNLLAVASAFAGAFGQPGAGATVKMPSSEYQQYCPPGRA